ncbi:hypothetical protein Brsp01_36450 [Brucella sp. NBRC 12950]|nr:hypothetical protein Brsp01_36450 [Brucella sp. NBRC 12950]
MVKWQFLLDRNLLCVNAIFENGVLKAIDTVAKNLGLTRSASLAQAARHEIDVGV